MGTTLRAELSKRNPYWLELHRSYELRHFCRQYPIWKAEYNSLLLCSVKCQTIREKTSKTNDVSDSTERTGIRLAYYAERINMIERTAVRTDPELSRYIVKGVTEGLSYDILKVRLDIPCCKDVYYDRYRKFFWLLDSVRQ